MKNILSITRTGALRMVAACGAVMTPFAAFAQANLAAVGGTVHTGLQAWGPVVSAGTALSGLAIAGGGLMKLKEAAADGGRQVKYSEGVWRLGAGAGLAALPTVINSFLATTVGTAGNSISSGAMVIN